MSMNHTQQAIQDLSRQILALKPALTESELDGIIATLIGGLVDSELDDRVQDLLDQSVIAEFLGEEVAQ